MKASPEPPLLSARKQRSLAGLCDVYESNYRALLHLMPALVDRQQGDDWLTRPITYRSVAADDGEPALYCAVEECSPYTTTLHLTYHFVASDSQDCEADPDLTIRVYHDAEQAETLRCGQNTHCEILRQFRGCPSGQMERRWQLNMLLHKWLQYLIERGHRFPLVV